LAEVKIGVGGNPDAAKTAIGQMTEAVNKLGKAVADTNKVQFKPVGIEQAEKDLAKLNGQFQEAVKRSRALREALKSTGQNAQAGILNVDWSQVHPDEKQAQRIRARAFSLSTRGTAWDQTNVPALPPIPAPRPSPMARVGGVIGRTGEAFASGFGGPVAQIGGEAISGARAGAQAATAEGGGAFMGGLGGLLKGVGIGTAVFGALKAGQMVSEGTDMAKERDLTLDTLKRQLGDVGVSFEALKEMSESLGQGLGIDAKEAAQLAEQFTQASHGVDRLPDAISAQVRGATGFSRAYGVQPSQGMGFFGGMQAMDSHRNNNELAVMLADAIESTQGHGLPSDVMQVVQSLAAATSRASLTSPNIAGFAGAYAGLVNEGVPGMTPENASNMLGRANSAVTGMGAVGEAGQNFILQAMNESGARVDPFAARALAAGGLFSTPHSTFGLGTKESPYTEYGQQMADAGYDMKKLLGPKPDMTLFEMIQAKAQRDFKDPQARANAMQRLLNQVSPQNAQAVMGMPIEDVGKLGRALAASGIDPAKINQSGLPMLEKISRAPSSEALTGLYGEISKRKDAGALTKEERDKLEAAKGGGTEDFRKALMQVMSGKGQEDTVASAARESAASLDTLQTMIGEQLIPLTTDIREAIVGVAGYFGVGVSKEREPTGKGSGLSAQQIDELKGRRKQLHSALDLAEHYGRQETMTDASGRDLTPEETRAARQNEIDEINRKLTPPAKDAATGGAPPAGDTLPADAAAVTVPPNQLGRLAMISAAEKKYGLPGGLVRGVYGTESSFGRDTGPSSAGALGNYQMLPGNLEHYNVKLGDFASETEGAAHMLSDLYKSHQRNLRATLADYGGFKTKSPDAYIGKVVARGGMDADATGGTPVAGFHSDPKIIELPHEKNAAPERDATSADATGGTPVAGFEPDSKIIELPPEKKASSASGAPAAAREGVQDTVVLDINMNVISGDGQGSKTVQQATTSVPVPRGTGVRRVAITN
jgi:hypothetical protein